MVVVRMSRAGTKKLPFYRLIVTDHRSKRDGNFLEKIGTWNPLKSSGEGKLELDITRFDHWVNLGARPSETVAKLVKEFRKTAPKTTV